MTKEPSTPALRPKSTIDSLNMASALRTMNGSRNPMTSLSTSRRLLAAMKMLASDPMLSPKRQAQIRVKVKALSLIVAKRQRQAAALN